jgi:hypothetical protein
MCGCCEQGSKVLVGAAKQIVSYDARKHRPIIWEWSLHYSASQRLIHAQDPGGTQAKETADQRHVHQPCHACRVGSEHEYGPFVCVGA